MPPPGIHIWKSAPFIRLLLPLAAGIIVEWYLHIDPRIWWYLSAFTFVVLFTLFFIPLFNRFRLSWLSGFIVNLLFISLAAILTWKNDVRHNSKWLGHFNKNSGVVVTLTEPLVEKANSYKVTARTEIFFMHERPKRITGNIILYFQKDSAVRMLTYGSQVSFNKPLQTIRNAGNPGGFDYKRYCLFQKITHQVYLKRSEFVLLPGKNESRLRKFIFSMRQRVLNILRSFIKGDKETGLAEALLIGYKDDLDKNLVQSYANTGVVHVIAISGLHIGLIYFLLTWLMGPLRKRKNLKWISLIIVLSSLWLFSLLAGAQASVLRSAVMFTCMVVGESLTRKTSIFNNLAVSAFLLLCYNPYWLWDVGFQLSYAAVLSIVLFMKPVYNLVYLKNKVVDFIWKLNAVTIAAQILTVPLTLYYFHQFPNYFLFTNIVSVPLSGIILSGEILLCAVSCLHVAAALIGKLLSSLIWLMNTYIECISILPFALTDNIQLSVMQAILLLIVAGSLAYWLLEKKSSGLVIALLACLLFVSLRTYFLYLARRGQKIIVYNVPGYFAMDIISGSKYFFIGDSALVKNDFLQNFHLKPARILYRVKMANQTKYQNGTKYFQLGTKRIMLIGNTISYKPDGKKIPVDLLVISKNPRLYISALTGTFSIKQIVFDGSVPTWKMRSWKKDCDSLRIPYHDVKETGAFVMNLR